MKIVSYLRDGRINADNILLEATIGEYLDFAKRILANNEFQRRRVKSTPALYTLLKGDLLRGCIMPPIVLAFGGENAPQGDAEGILDFIQDHAENLLILDGLQRTSTMLELEVELQARKDEDNLFKLRSNIIRLEVYVGINRLGVLYRMLTLNTGQTPMSLRQQVEILFLDYARVPLGGIQLIREVDDRAADKLGMYTFKAVIEGFNSYLERNELPIDRYDLLESVKSLEKLSREDEEKNLFQDFITTYHAFVMKVNFLSEGEVYTAEDLEIQGQPFGSDARKIFSKEQAIAGFGAGVSKLIDFKIVSSFDEVRTSIDKLTASESAIIALCRLLQRLESIRLQSKKIGNSQRLYFHFYFRELFNPEGDGFRDLTLAAATAYKKYESQML